MKNFFLVSTIILSMVLSNSTMAMDSKIKTVGVLAGYGIVGGALLGTASIAFGADAKSIAKGASLGLYAGLIFGGYMLLSYEYKKRGWGENREDYYPDSSSPYEDQQSNLRVLDLDSYSLASTQMKKIDSTLFYFNIADFQF